MGSGVGVGFGVGVGIGTLEQDVPANSKPISNATTRAFHRNLVILSPPSRGCFSFHTASSSPTRRPGHPLRPCASIHFSVEYRKN